MTGKTAQTYLWDAHVAGERILLFTAGKTVDDYLENQLLRSGVERQFHIIGEALGAVRRLDPGLAAQVSELSRAVAFRNILAHQYADIDDLVVWSTVVEKLPSLIAALSALLR